MMVIYAVCPLRSAGSRAIAEIGKPFGLIAPVRSIQEFGPESAAVVIQMWPPSGAIGINGPRPLVPGVDYLRVAARILRSAYGKRSHEINFVSGASAGASGLKVGA